MQSKTHIQELQISRFSESRKKLDGFHRIEIGNAQRMENAAGMMLQNNGSSSEHESQRNSRNSLAWDSAFFTSPGILEPEELFGTLNFQEMEHRVEMPRMVASDTFAQEETSKDSKFNSRRSLAWDSAFYTSAGVLDPEELCIVNKGFKEFGTDLRPGVGEKNWRSVKSNSKINGDGHCLARLEIDLFDDLKASLHVSSKASNAAISTPRQGGNNLQNTLSMKISDASSQVRMKSTPASRRQNMNMNKSERNRKDASLPPRAQSLKQILDRGNSPTRVVTKRASPCSKHMKLESNATNAASGQYMSVKKRPCLGNSCLVIPKSAASLKSPSSGSHAVRNVAASRNCGLSKSAGKSPLKFQKGKFDPRMAASCSFSPSRYSPRNQNGQLLYSPKSSESSASINQTFENSIESLHSTPCREMSFDVDASQASKSESRLHDHHSFRRENQDARFHDRHVNKFSTGNSPVLTDISTPSGLRMPSPKIGFFDADSTVAITLNGGDLKYHSGAHSSCCKSGNRSGAANGTTRGKLQSIRDSLRTSNLKLVSPLGIRNSHPGIMQNRKSMKREPLHIRKAKTQTLKENENSSSHSSEKMQQRLNEDDKENLCNNYNQVDSLSKHIEAIDLNRDTMTEVNKENIVL